MSKKNHRIGLDGFQFMASHFKSATCFTDGRLVIETIDGQSREFAFPVENDGYSQAIEYYDYLALRLKPADLSLREAKESNLEDNLYRRLVRTDAHVIDPNRARLERMLDRKDEIAALTSHVDGSLLVGYADGAVEKIPFDAHIYQRKVNVLADTIGLSIRINHKRAPIFLSPQHWQGKEMRIVGATLILAQLGPLRAKIDDQFNATFGSEEKALQVKASLERQLAGSGTRVRLPPNAPIVLTPA